MSNFAFASDEEIVAYLTAHFCELGIGEPHAGLGGRLLRGLCHGGLAIERCEEGFAVIAKANRKHTGAAAFIPIPPESDLMFLYVSPSSRSSGTGLTLLKCVQDKYMEDQTMILVCSGERRKGFFERAGFFVHRLTHQGFHFMACPARPPTD